SRNIGTDRDRIALRATPESKWWWFRNTEWCRCAHREYRQAFSPDHPGERKRCHGETRPTETPVKQDTGRLRHRFFPEAGPWQLRPRPGLEIPMRQGEWW